MGLRWRDAGGKRLHLVDLDGAKSGWAVNRDAMTRLVRGVGIPCELGGGIRDEATIRSYLDLGVERLVIGTLALKQPDWFRSMITLFPGRLVLGIDARDGMVATEGWLETSQTPAVELARQFEDLPLAAVVYTDIATDGMMQGPNVVEMQKMAHAVAIPVVASGGVATIDDVRALHEAGLHGCIIGRALYENTVDLAEAVRLAE